jgi:hypothetical protein
MSYEAALEAAGATVHGFFEFGSYQGDWWAKVTYEGETGWVNGRYGSCVGCDAFLMEFGDLDPTDENLAEFGRGYLDFMYTQEEAEKEAEKNASWDYEADNMVKFIKENA